MVNLRCRCVARCRMGRLISPCFCMLAVRVRLSDNDWFMAIPCPVLHWLCERTDSFSRFLRCRTSSILFVQFVFFFGRTYTPYARWRWTDVLQMWAPLDAPQRINVQEYTVHPTSCGVHFTISIGLAENGSKSIISGQIRWHCLCSCYCMLETDKSTKHGNMRCGC